MTNDQIELLRAKLKKCSKKKLIDFIIRIYVNDLYVNRVRKQNEAVLQAMPNDLKRIL